MYKVWIISKRRYLEGVFENFGEAMARGWREKEDFSILKQSYSVGNYRTIGWCCGPDFRFKSLEGSANEPLTQMVGS